MELRPPARAPPARRPSILEFELLSVPRVMSAGKKRARVDSVDSSIDNAVEAPTTRKRATICAAKQTIANLSGAELEEFLHVLLDDDTEQALSLAQRVEEFRVRENDGTLHGRW